MPIRAFQDGLARLVPARRLAVPVDFGFAFILGLAVANVSKARPGTVSSVPVAGWPHSGHFQGEKRMDWLLDSAAEWTEAV